MRDHCHYWKICKPLVFRKYFSPFPIFWCIKGGLTMYYKYKGISWIDKSHCLRRHVSNTWVTGKFLDLLIRLVLLMIMIIFTGISMILVVLNSGIIISMQKQTVTTLIMSLGAEFFRQSQKPSKLGKFDFSFWFSPFQIIKGKISPYFVWHEEDLVALGTVTKG